MQINVIIEHDKNPMSLPLRGVSSRETLWKKH